MPFPILVENAETFAILNFLRDFCNGEETETFHEVRELYLDEASSQQVQDGYVLTLDEAQSILKKINGQTRITVEGDD